MKLLQISVFGVLGACLTGQAHAGAWNQKAGEGQIISTSSWSQGDEIFDDDYDPIALGGFSKAETRLYLEHGLTSWLTIIGNGAFQSLDFQGAESEFEFDGLSDLELGLQFKVHAKEGFSSAIRASYVVDSRLDDSVVSILNGGDQFELRALVGQSRETPLGVVFYDAQLAVRSKTFSKIDASRGELTLGVKPTDRWLVMVQTYANQEVAETIDGFPVPEQFQLNTQVSLARQYKPGRYIQLGVGRTIDGRNIVKERIFFIGLWTEY